MMKTLIVTAVGAVLLASGGMYVAKGEQVEAASQRSVVSHYSQNAAVASDVTKLPEYKTLSSTVDLKGYSVKVIEDNYNKRIALFTDGNGHKQYKTVYVKKTGYIKVIKLKF